MHVVCTPTHVVFFNHDLSCIDTRFQTGTLIGRLLVRQMLQERGVPTDNMKFLTTPEGKPYLVRLCLLLNPLCKTNCNPFA